MKKNKFILHIIAFGFIVLSFIACDKDFATLNSDIINDENATNFDILSLRVTHPELTEVIAYTQALGPVQTNNLGSLNNLGVYDDAYGRTTSSFVTQLTTTSFDPVFGEEAEIDSVVLRIPYFSRAIDVEEDGNINYALDSVIGRDRIRLKLFESNYFIRNFDPNGEFSENQDYFSDMSVSDTETISESTLEGEELIMIGATQTSHLGSNIININDEGFVLEEEDEDGISQVSQRQSPGIRIKLDPAYWQGKIIDQEGEPVLSNENSFAEYFRGLYFKAEPFDDRGSFLTLNVGNEASNITIYYTRLTPSAIDDPDATEQATYELRFGPNRINFMENDFSLPINSGNQDDGDSRIYLKGGQGSIARIKLFNGYNTDDIPEMNDFEAFKNTFVETDQDGDFIKSKLLVNEANLVFYVDQDIVQDGEPNRIYLYDVDNKTPLFDYFLDLASASLPSFSRTNHLGPLQRVNDEPTEDGIKYKLKITEHINNLLLRDSTNVNLGLTTSLNVNLEESVFQRKVRDTDDSDFTVPISSILTPRGTILFGNNILDNDSNSDKKVYLEIYYTEPNN